MVTGLFSSTGTPSSAAADGLRTLLRSGGTQPKEARMDPATVISIIAILIVAAIALRVFGSD
jgi:hypothetical protein